LLGVFVGNDSTELFVYASVEIAASAAANVVRQESKLERMHLIKLIR